MEGAPPPPPYWNIYGPLWVSKGNGWHGILPTYLILISLHISLSLPLPFFFISLMGGPGLYHPLPLLYLLIITNPLHQPPTSIYHILTFFFLCLSILTTPPWREIFSILICDYFIRLDNFIYPQTYFFKCIYKWFWHSIDPGKNR